MFKYKSRFMKTMGIAAALLVNAQVAAAVGGASEGQQSLYDRLGGLAPISVVVSDFIDILAPDVVLNANPAIDAATRRVPASYLKYQVTGLVCQVTGGPCQYHGRGLRESHARMNITGKEWDRMVALFKEVLAKHNVPAAETRQLLEIIDSTKPDIVIAQQR